MQIGFLYAAEDTRCPFSAKTLQKYKKNFESIHAEKELMVSTGISISNEDLKISDRSTILSQCDVIYSSVPINESELSTTKKGAILISFYNKFHPDAKVYTGKHDIQAFSMDMIPRTTLAQSMDVLSSMASIAGYKSVLLAASELPRYFPMMMTAAGTIKPATVLILGAGVAGLQAIATARRLGAKVEVFDVRKAVKEEVQSLGAKFVEVEGSKDDKAAGGYAVEQDEDYQRKQKEKIADHVGKADVVITTAQLRGRPAPILITEEMVKSMKFGSVIVDLAASTGGNCALTKDNETVEAYGIKIIGNSYLAHSAIIDASELLSNNIANYIATFIAEEGLHVDLDNEIIAKSRMYPKIQN